MSKKTKTNLVQKKRWKVIGLIFFLVFLMVVVGLAILWSYTPTSTITWTLNTEDGDEITRSQITRTCGENFQLYPPTLYNWRESPFPAYSPDGRFYTEISDGWLGKKKTLRFYWAETGQEIGEYYSQYSSLIVYCWTEDSSGIYVRDFEPSGTGFGIFQRSSKTGPIKKLLVP